MVSTYQNLKVQKVLTQSADYYAICSLVCNLLRILFLSRVSMMRSLRHSMDGDK